MALPCSDLSVFHVASTLCTEKLFPTNLQHSPFMNNSEPFSKPLAKLSMVSTLIARVSNLLVMALNSNLPAMTYKQLSGVENPPELLLRLLQPFANPF